MSEISQRIIEEEFSVIQPPERWRIDFINTNDLVKKLKGSNQIINSLLPSPLRIAAAFNISTHMEHSTILILLSGIFQCLARKPRASANDRQKFLVYSSFCLNGCDYFLIINRPLQDRNWGSAGALEHGLHSLQCFLLG